MKLLIVVTGLFATTLGVQVNTAAAQAGRPGEAVFEVGGFGGALGGLPSDQFAAAFVQGLRLAGGRNITTNPGSSAKWLAGGHVGANLGSRVLVTFDVLTSRIGNPSFSGTIVTRPFSASLALMLTEYLGGVQYIVSQGRVAPYVAAGFGMARLSAKVSSSSPTAISISENDVVTSFGGGVRLFTGSAWGIRPDFRVVRVPGETYFRVSGGVFYQVR